jgi:hypothetical protein
MRDDLSESQRECEQTIVAGITAPGYSWGSSSIASAGVQAWPRQILITAAFRADERGRQPVRNGAVLRLHVNREALVNASIWSISGSRR